MNNSLINFYEQKKMTHPERASFAFGFSGGEIARNRGLNSRRNNRKIGPVLVRLLSVACGFKIKVYQIHESRPEHIITHPVYRNICGRIQNLPLTTQAHSSQSIFLNGNETQQQLAF